MTTEGAGCYAFLTGQRLPGTYIVSYVSYQTAEVTVREGRSSEIRLHQTSNQLRDAVVMAYGRRRHVAFRLPLRNGIKISLLKFNRYEALCD